MDHHNFDLTDIPINVSNIDDDNNGSSEGEYPVFEINLNEMYHEDDDNIDQHIDSKEEVGDDGGAGEDFHNEMTSEEHQWNSEKGTHNSGIKTVEITSNNSPKNLKTT
ncbi:hypothetical protein LIER_00902 [Lithospermum erythrorhizon]|uniref:Uncharacterized protein n=1 Tax=Lithospermum erythrorhizon TaxID=34254 RepID=A0AAV3NK90_LITER